MDITDWLGQRTGLWRGYSLYALLRGGHRLSTGGYTFKNSVGEFYAPDFAGLYQWGDWWENKVKKIVGAVRNGLFVDIGANIGFYSAMALKNGNKVIALEPNVKAFQALSKNAPRAELYPFAAWHQDGIIRFTEGKHTDVSHISDTGDIIPCRKIDSLLKGRMPDLVKIDVEGAEFQVLEGMTETLRNGKSMKIIFEALSDAKLRLCSAYLRSFVFIVIPLDRTNYYALNN